MQLAIPFPDFLSPVLIEIPLGFTSLPIRWYALAYIVGIMIGYRFFRNAIDRPTLWKDNTAAMDRARLEDLLVWMILGVILGGRLGYVIFYGEGQFLSDPLAVLRVWEGGMAFHGGFIGVITAAAIFARRHGISYGKLADGLAIATPPGLLLGRIANFINAELWGRPTDAPWGVIFPGQAAQNCPDIAGLCARHPSQLYEAGLEGLILGAVLLYLAFRGGWLKTPWALTGLFIAGYGASRFFVELYRQADAQFITPDNPMGYVASLGPLGVSMGQLLSLPMILIGLAILIRARRA